jgi:probable phosphoglycerate mutase
MSTSRLLLVRHGQIVANIDQRWHGSTDGHLTERGREEAELVATHLARTRPEVAAVYSSPLTRARDTAAQIARALGLPVIVATGLAEYGIGILENETYADLAGAHRFFEQAEADLEWAPSGGESLNGVATRVLATWRQVAHEHRGREVALVSHGAAIAIGLATVLDGNPRLWPRYRLRNTSVTEIVLEPAPRLIAFDLVHHLEAVY